MTTPPFRSARSKLINDSMSHYGLIGYPLKHSFSPDYFRKKFEREDIHATYEALPLEDVTEFPRLARTHPHLRGLNVTTPHKQAVMAYLDSISEDAQAIGAVNCITISEGKLSGYNTDWVGFRDSLKPLLNEQHHRALILGGGGASLAIQYALRQMGIHFLVVSRRPEDGSISYADVTDELLNGHLLIVNTTTLGTLGEGLPPIPYEAITPEHLLYDLVYNPELTPFLREGMVRGAKTKSGLEMLYLQAEASWEIWQRGGL